MSTNHWEHFNVDNVTYSIAFKLSIFQKKLKKKKFKAKKSIAKNIYRMNANDSMMCGYISAKHVDFILTVKLCYFIQIYTEYEKDEKIVLEKFEIKIFIYRYILKR